MDVVAQRPGFSAPRREQYMVFESGEVPGWDGVCKGQLMEDIYLHTRELEIDPIGNGNIPRK